MAFAEAAQQHCVEQHRRRRGALRGIVADLGTQADAGGNTFTGNTSTGLQINLSWVGPVQAVGNKWNPNVQGADNTGHYTPPAQKTERAGGTNYVIGNAGVLDL
jgi:hypothetical protein